MSSRSRRKISRSRAFRRLVHEHRYNATEAFLGVVALVLGLWLIWPEGDDPAAEMRKRWQQSLLEREATSERAVTRSAEMTTRTGRLEMATSRTASSQET